MGTTSGGSSAVEETAVAAGNGQRPLDAGSQRPAPAETVGRGGYRPRWWIATRPGVWMAASRVVAGVLVAHVVVVLFPQALLHSKLGTLSTGTWLDAFDRWDARYYLTIAAHGYPAHASDFRAFFPGYPLMVRLVHDVTGGLLSYTAAGCLVSFASFVVASGLLYGLIARRFGTRAALVSTLLFCWFPTSLFFLAPYSEALFALEIVAVATLLDRSRWWWAAIVAGYASATSPESVALTAALVVAALVARRGIGRTIGYAAVGSFGAAAFVTFLGIRFGDPLGFSNALPSFHRVVMAPYVGLIENVGGIVHDLRNPGSAVHVLPNLSAKVLQTNEVWMWMVDDAALILAGVALITLIVMAVRAHRDPNSADHVPVPIAWIVVLAGITLLASMSVVKVTGAPANTEAAARLVSVAFPLYVGLYLLVRRWQAPIIIGLSLSIAAAVLTQIMFNLGYWVT